MKKHKILFIEDNEEYAQLMIKLLEFYDYSVTWVNSYDQLMDSVTESNIPNYDLIISDVELPKFNGDQVIKFIYLKGKGFDIPVLFCSGVYDESFIGTGTLHQNFADDHFLYIDFCEKGKNKWLLYKVKQLIALKEKFTQLKKNPNII